MMTAEYRKEVWVIPVFKIHLQDRAHQIALEMMKTVYSKVFILKIVDF